MERLLVYLGAFIVPLVFALITPVCKAITEHRKIKMDDWFLGLDFQLAGFAAGSINLFDRIKQIISGELTETPRIVIVLTTTGCYICASFLLLLFYMYIHQQYVSQKNTKIWTVKVFGLGSTILGALWIYGFAVLKVRGAI